MSSDIEGAQAMVKCRKAVQWGVLVIVLITLGLGWRFHWLGFSVPFVMLVGVIGSLFNGRYVCGNLCPRGSFYDRVMAPFSPKRPIPQWIRSKTIRWTLFVLLMGLMAVRILQNPLDPMHWGRVFWMMCLVTTAVGVPLALLIHPRTWCSFCPIGTVQSAIGGRKNPLHIDGDLCQSCALCERSCPMGLSIVEHKDTGIVSETDCLRCSECAAVCPVNALGNSATS
ncbi:MAG: 4Fe-4S binding protein [Candidatus Bipolaricaulota bacterium]